MKKAPLSMIAALLLDLLCASPTHAQESSGGTVPSLSSGSVGTLGNHEFVTSSYMKDPFIRTFFRTGLGFGITPKLVVPLVTINDTSYYGLKGSLLYAVLDVEYQYRVRDWLSVRGRMRVIGRMADETPTLISQGVTLLSDFDLGWLVRIHQSDRFLLSSSLHVRSASATDVYLQRFIEGIIEDGAIKPANKLVQTTPTLRGGCGLLGAYAISDLVGLSFSGDLEYGESVDRISSDEWTYALVAAVDFNLLRTSGTPLGFMAGVQSRSFASGQLVNKSSIWAVFGRIGYTGSREFSLGLDLGYEVTPVRGVESRKGYMSAIVDTKLYF